MVDILMAFLTVFIFSLIVLPPLYLLLDYFRSRLIWFKPHGESYWRIAFSEVEMWRELDGRTAQIIMPSKPLIVRIWRKFFPLKGTNEKITFSD